MLVGTPLMLPCYFFFAGFLAAGFFAAGFLAAAFFFAAIVESPPFVRG